MTATDNAASDGVLKTVGLAVPLYPEVHGPSPDKRIEVLTSMVLDLYAQQIAMLALMEKQGLGLPIGYIVEAKKQARLVVAGICGAQGYDDTPDAEHLKRVAVALRG